MVSVFAVVSRLAAAAKSGLHIRLGTGGGRQELQHTTVTAKIGGLPIEVGMKDFGRVHSHPADRILGYDIGRAHNHSFL
jgi:hypothetical protein